MGSKLLTSPCILISVHVRELEPPLSPAEAPHAPLHPQTLESEELRLLERVASAGQGRGRGVARPGGLSVAWVHGHAARLGGDPRRIFVCGHAAGGHLVTMMMGTDWPAFAGLPRDLVKGGCAISGVFDLEPVRLCYLNDTLGLTPAQVADNSPVRLAATADAPLILAVGGDESDEFRRQSADLDAAWRDRGASVQVITRPWLTHFNIMSHFASRSSPLTTALIAPLGLA